MGSVTRWGIGIALLGILAVAGFAACSSGEGENADIGKSCNQDSDCPDALVCEADNTCQECTPCQVRDDCPQGYTCDQTLNCCKVVACNGDEACVDPKYCIEFVCREKPCTEDADCTRERHYCLQGVCERKECETHLDCDSNLCDTENYVCKTCVLDNDCPYPLLQICSQGVCEDRQTSDGDDTIGKKEGCDEFITGCLYTRLSCFNKINPAVSYASCREVKDSDGYEGFEFVFPDGSVWLTIGIPARYHQARGEGGFCYHIVPEPFFNRLAYYDSKDGEFLGSYSVDVTRDVVIITCPDDTKEYYGLNTLRNEFCPGFPLSGIYTPPAPGIEGCTKLDEEE